MNRRKAFGLIATAPLALRTSSTMAGGMAVVYLIGDLPKPRAGIPFSLRFAVLGHDMIDHLWCGFDAEITLIPRDGGDEITFSVPGRKGDFTAVGAYSTEITVPQSGSYKWHIRPGSWEPTYFPTLIVDDPEEDPTPVAHDNVIEIGPDGFHPSLIEVTSGASVTWRNLDAHSAHQVTWRDLHLDDSPPFPKGGEYTHVFDGPGEYEYFCGPHPHMTGTVVVTGA